MRTLLTLLITSALPWSPVRAADPEPANVRVEMKVVSLPRTFALPLLPALSDGASADEIMARLDEMIQKGDGVLEAWLHAHRSGVQFPRSSSQEEQRYMIEFEQPQMPRIFGSGEKLNQLAEGVIPTTFETQFLGVSLEIGTAEVRGEDSIEVRCTSKDTILEGWTRAAAGISASGIAISHPQPKFSARSLTTGATLKNKRWMLVGTFPRKGEPPRTELRFLRATIINAPRTP